MAATVELPFCFVWELKQQKNSLYYAWDSKIKDSNSGFAESDFNGTTAPGNDWNNYLGHPLSLTTTSTDKKSTTYNMPYGTISLPDNLPYRPGLSAIMRYGLEKGDSYAWTSQSSGLDCGAIIGAAASYDNRGFLYTIPMGTNDWTADRTATMDPENLNKAVFSWVIDEHDIFDEIDGYNQGSLNISLPIYPGDIVIFEDPYDNNGAPEPKRPPHVAMVAFVRYDESGLTNYNDIVLIEAASGFSKQYQIINSQSLFAYISHIKNSREHYTDKFVYRRLIH